MSQSSGTIRQVQVVLDQPLRIKHVLDEPPGTLALILSFLRLRSTEDLLLVRHPVDSFLTSLTSHVLRNVIKENYRTHKQPLNEKFHIKEVVYSRKENSSIPWNGLYFIEDQKGCKMVLSVSLDQKSIWVLGTVSIYVPAAYEQIAFNLIKEIQVGISRIKRTVFDGHGHFLELRDAPSWNDIIIAKDIRDILQRSVMDFLEKKEAFARRGIPWRRGVLLHGPPGNGKTLIGRLLATNANANCVWVTAANIHDPSDMTGIFNFARAVRPAIVYLEDIDILGGEGRMGIKFKSLLGELLTQLDGATSNEALICVATTNDVTVLDAAAIRPGRFDVKIEIQNPGDEQRLNLLSLYTSKFGLAGEVDLKKIAEMTSGLSCVAVRETVNQALMLSIEENPSSNELRMDHLVLAAGMMNPKKESLGFSGNRNGLSAYAQLK